MASIFDRSFALSAREDDGRHTVHAFAHGTAGALCGRSELGRALSWAIDLTAGEAAERMRCMPTCGACETAVRQAAAVAVA